MGSLKDSLPLMPPRTLRPKRNLVKEEKHRWLVDKLDPRPGSITLGLRAPNTITFSVEPVRAKARDVASMKAKKFGDLIANGMPPGEAAKKLKTTVRELMSKEQTQKVVKELIEGYTFDAHVRKLLARALVNKGLIENSTEGGDSKLLVDFLKLANQDSELGITAPATQIGPVITMDPALKDLLDRTIPVPQLEPPQDAEFTEIKEEPK